MMFASRLNLWHFLAAGSLAAAACSRLLDVENEDPERPGTLDPGDMAALWQIYLISPQEPLSSLAGEMLGQLYFRVVEPITGY